MDSFTPFPKISRLMRDIIITEKIDGTNAQVNIRPATSSEPNFLFSCDIQVNVAGVPHYMRAGSRTRWLREDADNHGFWRWVHQYAHELAHLGPGAHFGEWWGNGIQRNYSQTEKRFSLFNVHRWADENVRPPCCGVAPTLWTGPFDMNRIHGSIIELSKNGSLAAPGFMKPEGIVVYHTASNTMFKRTIEKDDAPKGGNHGS